MGRGRGVQAGEQTQVGAKVFVTNSIVEVRHTLVCSLIGDRLWERVGGGRGSAVQ